MAAKPNTITKRYSFEKNGASRLEITLNPVENKCAISLDNRSLASLTYKDVLQGTRLQLPDNTSLELQAVFRRFAPQLIIKRDGVFLPGSEKGEITIGKPQPLGLSSWMLVLLFIVVMIGGVGALVIRGFENYHEDASAQATRQSLLAVYQNNMANYTELSELKTALVDNPKIKGALLRIDKTKNDLDSYYIQHPFALPDNPANVGFVLWLTCQDRQIGTYDDGKRALQTTCDLTLIDLSAKVIIDQQSFTGPRPPEVKRHSGDESGGRPDDQIETYIASLATP